MATIGLDRLFYAPIIEANDGSETYGTPVSLAKAISAELSVEVNEATLYADDGVAEAVKEFKSGKLTLGIDDIGTSAANALTGAQIDSNHVLVSASENGGIPVAIGFRARKSNGTYKYFWLYRVIFGIPATNLSTKGDSITFSTPTREGTIYRRNKLDGQNKHPWKAEANEGDTGLGAEVISGWFSNVYEPTFSGTDLSVLTIGSLTLTPAFSANTTGYTAATTNATNTVTATAADADATIAIAVGDTAVTNGQSATWVEGANTLTVSVTKGNSTKTYTVTVTKS